MLPNKINWFLLTTLFETEMYNNNLLFGVGFSKMGVNDTASFTASKEFSHSLLHVNLSAFFNAFTIDMIFSAILGKKRDRYVNFPTRLCTSFKHEGLRIENTTEHLLGLAFIPLWVSIKPRNFPPAIPNTHFVGFKCMSNRRSCPNTSFRSVRC